MTRERRERACAFIGRLSGGLGAILLIINVTDIAVGVTMRYFFHAAPIWTEELARFSMVWLVLIGAASAFLNGDQMAIDFLAAKLPPKGQKFCALLSVAVQAVVLAVLVWFGARNLHGNWKIKTMALGIPKAIPLVALPVGMALFLLALLLKTPKGGDGR